MKITFLPQNITWEAEAGETILQAAVKAGVNIDGNCAGMGTCGKCKVKIIEGDRQTVNDHHHKLSENEISHFQAVSFILYMCFRSQTSSDPSPQSEQLCVPRCLHQYKPRCLLYILPE